MRSAQATSSWLRDLGSTNGTRLGDHRLAPAGPELADGARFRVGTVLFAHMTGPEVVRRHAALRRCETAACDALAATTHGEVRTAALGPGEEPRTVARGLVLRACRRDDRALAPPRLAEP